MELEYSTELDSDFVDSKKEKNVVITPFMEHEWVGLNRVGKKTMLLDYETKVDIKDLDHIAKTVYDIENSHLFIRKISKLMSDRKSMYKNDRIDWGMAETLAYGSILKESYNVRISGQDVEEELSHRHAILKKKSLKKILYHLIK